MLELQLQVKRNRSWFSSKGSVEIDAEFKAPRAIPFTNLLERLFIIAPDFLPVESFQQNPPALQDLRGRPTESFDSRQGSSGEEELFYTNGVLFEVEEQDLEPLPEIPFTYKISTRFESFEDGAHIRHRVVHSTDPVLEEVLPSLSPKIFARLFPARIEKLRFGMEAYRPRLSGSFFGMLPMIQERLYLEFSANSIRLRATSEYKGSTPSLPFHERNLLRHFGQALKELQLFPNFSEELERGLLPTS